MNKKQLKINKELDLIEWIDILKQRKPNEFDDLNEVRLWNPLEGERTWVKTPFVIRNDERDWFEKFWEKKMIPQPFHITTDHLGFVGDEWYKFLQSKYDICFECRGEGVVNNLVDIGSDETFPQDHFIEEMCHSCFGERVTR